MRWGVLVAVVLATGCATGLPKCPTAGGPAWRAVQTDHFVVYTDGSSQQAKSIAADLEFARAALVEFMPRGWGDPPGTIPVVALHGDGHYEEFFPRSTAGIYTEAFLQPLIILGGRRGLSNAVVVKHELMHYLLDAFIPAERLPRWVGEGLATFTETMELDREGGKARFGKTVDDRVLFALAKYYPQRIMNQWRVEMLLVGDGAFYGQSWLKVHYLINVHGAAFAAFLGALRKGESEDAAWQAAFPDLPQALLDLELTQYVKSGRWAIMTIRVPPEPQRAVESPVADADVHAWRALFYAMRAKMNAGDAEAVRRGRAEIADAQRQDEGHVRALAAVAAFGDTIPLDRARRATQAHAEDWLAWQLLAEAEVGEEARSAATKEALRRAESNPSIRLKDKLQGNGKGPSGGHDAASPANANDSPPSSAR